MPNSNAANPSDYGLKEGDLISAIFSDDPDVYIVNRHGYKRLFLNPEIFNFYGHLGGFINVKLVTPGVRDAFPTSGYFRNCENNDQKVYGIEVNNEDTGILRWIDTSGEQAVSDDADFFKKVFCINNSEFNWYPRGQVFKSVKEVPQYTRKRTIPVVTIEPVPPHPFNLPPVISGISGPSSLRIGEIGVWSVTASDPEGRRLSYSVIWGDEIFRATYSVSESLASNQQTATFTHSYSGVGTYQPTFIVTDDGFLTAKSSLSVKVGGGIIINNPPQIVSFPKVPSTIVVGQRVSFIWSATDADNDNLSWSIDWGDSGYGGACPQPNPQNGEFWTHKDIHTWQFPGTYTITATVNDCRGGTNSHTFKVTVEGGVTQSITVLSPNGGETWTRGTTQTIKWQGTIKTCLIGEICPLVIEKSYDITLVPYYPPCTENICPSIPYIMPYTIINGVFGSSYNWLVGEISGIYKIDTISDGSYTIQICQTGSRICDSSDSYFKIVSPNILTITTSSPLPNAEVGISYSTNISAISGTGSYSWVLLDGSLPPRLSLLQDILDCIRAPCPNQNPAIISGTPTVAGIYTFVIQVSSDPLYGDGPTSVVEKRFSLTVSSGPQPSVTVLSPNGGEQWVTGSTHTISWTAFNVSPDSLFGIRLKKGGVIFENTTYIYNSSIRSAPYKVPANTLGSDYKIEVVLYKTSRMADIVASDESSAPFSIVSSQPTQNLTVSRHGSSPSGFVAQNALRTDLLRFTINGPVGTNVLNAVFSKIGFEIRGGYANYLSDLKVINSVTRATLASAPGPFSSGVYDSLSLDTSSNFVAYRNSTLDVTISAAISPSAWDLCSTCSRAFWIVLNDLIQTPVLPAYPISGLPIQGHQVTVASSQLISNSSFSRDLTVGSTGSDVKQLQAFLVNEVDYPANLITGYFGSITLNAVKKFQEKYGIEPIYSYFGPITRKALSALISG